MSIDDTHAATATADRFRFVAAMAVFRALLFGALLGALGLTAPAARAHESIGSVSNAVVIVRGAQVEYYLSIPGDLKQQLFSFASTAWYRDYFAGAIKLTSGGKACPLQTMSNFVPQASGNTIVQLEFGCAQAVRDLTLTSEVFLDSDDKHVQLVKLVEPGNLRHVLSEGMLTNAHRSLHIADVDHGVSLTTARVAQFFTLGVEHILSGYDHILFLVVVILVSVSLLDTLKMVTSFTLAHSITLALAFTGVINLPSSLVEPLIALTIVYVAFENLFARRIKRRWLLTFAFGLVHGLGFVGVLKEITLSRSELLTALVSFNLGIETGQLLIVVPLGWLIYRFRNASWRPAFIRVSSIGTGLVGLFWFIERVPFGALRGLLRAAG